MAYQRIGSVPLRVGIPAGRQLARLTMVPNRTRASMPSSNPFLVEALPLGLAPLVGEAVPLLPRMVRRGMHPLDLAGPEEEEEVVAAAVVDGVDGVGHRRVQQPRGLQEGVAAAAVAVFGPSRLLRLFLSTLGVVSPPP